MRNDIEWAAAEMLAAYREHQAFLNVGGHEPKRLDRAADDLWRALEERRSPMEASHA